MATETQSTVTKVLPLNLNKFIIVSNEGGGKKVDLSIADMVMGKGYVSGPGNKFKAKSLSGRVLKKKKLKK